MLPAQSSSRTGTEHFLGLVPLRGGTHLCVTGCLAARGALPAAPGRASPHSHDHPVITRHQHRTHGTVPNVGRTTELQETQPALITPNTQPKPTPSSRTAHYKCPPPTPPRVLVNTPCLPRFCRGRDGRDSEGVSRTPRKRALHTAAALATRHGPGTYISTSTWHSRCFSISHMYVTPNGAMVVWYKFKYLR